MKYIQIKIGDLKFLHKVGAGSDIIKETVECKGIKVSVVVIDKPPRGSTMLQDFFKTLFFIPLD